MPSPPAQVEVEGKGKPIARLTKGHPMADETKEDKEREERIAMEIVVDAYDEEERAMGWYYYLDDTLGFPFRARCLGKRSTSPLKKGDEVEVTGLADAEECEREMFVTIRWERRKLDVPLS